MKQSNALIPTLKEVPASAETISHQMMLKAGYIYQVSAGIYAYLPLAKRVKQKINHIIREEMDTIHSVEMEAPDLIPADLWKQSDRYESYGPNLFKLKDRHDRDFILGPTHEETFTEIIRDSIKTYKKLPICLYQITAKYRDEDRPRFGLLRGRVFDMFDGYSFSTNTDDLDTAYDDMAAAYINIFNRCGLNYKIILGDSGAMGGHASQEFSAISEAGEDTIAYSTDGDYAANLEMATNLYKPQQSNEAQKPLHKVKADISVLEQSKDPTKVIKAAIYVADDKPVMVLVRGDHEANEIKVSNYLNAEEFHEATAEEIQSFFNCDPNFVGPVNANASGLRILVDRYARDLTNATVGANEDGFIYENANLDRDFKAEKVADFKKAVEGETAPDGKGTLKFMKGIEIGHIFKLGTRYSKYLGATVLDQNGQQVNVIMGCYGIGVSRLLSAIAEQYADEKGLVWPKAVAPFDVHILELDHNNADQRRIADQLEQELKYRRYSALIDDRDERPGVKFADSDLIGIPLRVILGDKLRNNKADIVIRKTGETFEVDADQILTRLLQLV